MATHSPSPETSGDDADLLSLLSLEEKAALLSGRDFWTTQPVDKAGIASIVMTDGPHGVRRQVGATDHLGANGSEPATCFPLAVAVGSSWDPTVAERIGEAIGREASALGVDVLLGPGINIKRSPLCGRNFEYYSEDPVLSGVLGAGHVTGLTSEGVGASVKHFAANNQETERMRISADVDERTLQEIYLPAFEHVVTRARPATVMAAYNSINGVPASENHWLLTEVLRNEWGFTGTVVSDWGGVLDPVAALRGGLDLEMPGTNGRSAARLIEAVRSGELDETQIDAAALRVIALSRLSRNRVISGDTDSPVDFDAQHALARKLAAECAVLLKNDDDVLPLSGQGTVAVIGEFARTPRFQGGGSSRVNSTRVDVPLDFIRDVVEAAGGTTTFAPGFTLDSEGLQDGFTDAVAAAAGSDVAIVFAGLAESDESEGFDRETLTLPSAQIDVIRAVAEAAPRTVVVLANGGTVTLEGWHDDVDAVLEGHLLGQAAGSAVTDLLFGATNPSGKLAETLPIRLVDTASFANFPGEQGHVRYGEGVLVGYRWHEAAEIPSRYPFGHGLSYTSFSSEHLTVTVTGPDTVNVEVTVTNTGARAGRHVAQVYVSTDAGPVRRPVRELKAFEKVTLEPGESRRLTWELDRRAFAYWDIDTAGWVVAPGSYAVQVCADAATVLLEKTVELDGDDIIRALTLMSTVDEWFAHPLTGDVLRNALAGDAAAKGGTAVTPQLLRMIGSMPMSKVADMLADDVPREFFDSLMSRSRDAATPASTTPDAA